MNIKQFLIFKACDVLPPELKYYILELVQNEASLIIQRMFYFKIAKNVDIFTKIMHISSKNNKYNYDYVNRYIRHIMNNITYSYIQEPEIWIYILEKVMQLYGNYRNFHLNNIFNIINSIEYSNSIK